MKALIKRFDLGLSETQIIATIICTLLSLTLLVGACKLVGFYFIAKGH